MKRITLALIGVLVVLGLATEANATKPNPKHKVTLCHRTDSNTNPYVVITVDVASVKFEGHDSHNGPVWDPTLKDQHIKWGDIIPAFTTADGYPFDYPGKNLTDAGVAILDNGCKPVQSSPSPTESPSPTGSPSPSPSETGTPSPSNTGTPSPSGSTVPPTSPPPGHTKGPHSHSKTPVLRASVSPTAFTGLESTGMWAIGAGIALAVVGSGVLWFTSKRRGI